MTTTTAPPTTTAIPTTTANDRYTLVVSVLSPEGDAIFRGRAYYRLRFEVVSANLIPEEVFIHQRIATPNGPHEEFMYIASPVDLVRIPVGTPDDEGYHRLPYADLLIESITLTDLTIETIQSSLQDLVNGIRRLDNIVERTNFTVEG